MSPILATRAGVSAIGYGMFGGGAPATAFESIATATGTGSSATITFSAIPSTFQHLQVRWRARSTFATSSAVAIQLTINSDTGTNYAYHNLWGDGSSANASGSATTDKIVIGNGMAGNSMTSGVMGVGLLDIQDYASTTKNTTSRIFCGIDTNTTTGAVRLMSGLWINTNAVSSLTFTANNGNFGTDTTFALYGIKG